jgi:hypothetical protein
VQGGIGFVPQFFPQSFEALELLDGAAVLVFGRGLMAQQQGETVASAGQAVEAVRQHEVAILGQADFDIRGDLRVHGIDVTPLGRARRECGTFHQLNMLDDIK